jgi:23S rRNA (pseudouridine1915-N3)-methyltransferase
LNAARIRILAIGKVRRAWIREGIDQYLKRLPGLSIVELKDSNPTKEAEAIRATIRPEEILVVLMEQGPPLTSFAFAARIETFAADRIAFVLGGADGISQDLKQQASWQLSLSSMTYPHELARLMLVEQLYRARSIHQGTPYHRA